MEITKIGHSSFKIKDKGVTLVTDPFDFLTTGIKFPKTEAIIVTVSHDHQDHNYKQGISGEPMVLEGPGEYEVAGVFIKGIATFHDNSQGKERGKNTVYKIELNGIKIAHLGDLGHKLSDKDLDQLGDVDILLIPVGGTYTISSKQAVEIVSQIEPRIVIPMHYNDPQLKTESVADLETVDAFLREIGKDKKVLPKLVISKNQLPQELEVIVLE